MSLLGTRSTSVGSDVGGCCGVLTPPTTTTPALQAALGQNRNIESVMGSLSAVDACVCTRPLLTSCGLCAEVHVWALFVLCVIQPASRKVP